MLTIVYFAIQFVAFGAVFYVLHLFIGGLSFIGQLAAVCAVSGLCAMLSNYLILPWLTRLFRRSTQSGQSPSQSVDEVSTGNTGSPGNAD